MTFGFKPLRSQIAIGALMNPIEEYRCEYRRFVCRTSSARIAWIFPHRHKRLNNLIVDLPKVIGGAAFQLPQLA